MTALLQTYGWKGAFLVSAGIISKSLLSFCRLCLFFFSGKKHVSVNPSVIPFAGIVLNSAVCGALFRPLDSFAKRKPKTKVFELEVISFSLA